VLAIKRLFSMVLSIFAACIRLSHQEQISIEGTADLTEQELEELSEKNVERWVSLHVIPVGVSPFHTSILDSRGLD
jgi:hypothetical protein